MQQRKVLIMKVEKTPESLNPVMLSGEAVQAIFYALNNICIPKKVFSEDELDVVNHLLQHMMDAFDAAQAGIEPEYDDMPVFDESEDVSEEDSLTDSLDLQQGLVPVEEDK